MTFARPIRRELRKRMNAECPEVEEPTRVGTRRFPDDGTRAGMAALLLYGAFGFCRSVGRLASAIGAEARPREASEVVSRLTCRADLSAKSTSSDS